MDFFVCAGFLGYFIMKFICHSFFFYRLQIQENDYDWKDYAFIEDSLAYTVKDLNPSSTYRFRVLAENIHGRSQPSVCSEDIRIEAPKNGNLETDGNTMSKELHDNDVSNAEIFVKSGGDYKTRFEIQEELGKGRFGIVHKVIEIETGQTLAAKTVKCIKSADKLKVTHT